jgi:hypothetical protein
MDDVLFSLGYSAFGTQFSNATLSYPSRWRNAKMGDGGAFIPHLHHMLMDNADILTPSFC